MKVPNDFVLALLLVINAGVIDALSIYWIIALFVLDIIALVWLWLRTGSI